MPKGQIPWNKGKTGVYSEETKRKISESLKKRRQRPPKLTELPPEKQEEIKKMLSERWKGDKNPLRKKKLNGEDLTPWNKGKTMPEWFREKLSKAFKGRIPWNKGKKGYKHSEETKKKMRLAAIRYIKEVRGFVHPRIGRHEKQILDELEIKLGYRIIRQYQVGGYFLDGYIPEINLAIEVDERPKTKKKDIEREEFIKQKLGCQFLRIKDYEE